MSYKKFDDNFNSIIKSLKPIKLRFSKQSLYHDKIFKKSSLETLDRKLNGPKKSPENFQSSQLYKKIDYLYNVRNNSYDYFEDIKGAKNIPLKINKKGYNFVKNLYNPEFEVKPEDRYFYNDNAKRYFFDAKRYNRSKKLFKFEVFALDPGYYHPNYNYIKKRIPCIDFSKSRNIQEKNEMAKTSDDNNKENSRCLENKENIINSNQINHTNNIEIEEEKLNNYNNSLKTENEENSQKEENNKSKNILNFKYSITPKKSYPITNNEEVKKIKKYNLPKIQKIHKSTSQITISTPIMISFNKMIGRNKKNTQKLKLIKGEEIDYSPNYSCTLPHVRSVSFKSNGNMQNHKKFIVNKILRSYYFNSDSYYVIDCKKNEKKEL